MDLYCCTCDIPICTTCSHGNHSGHTYCELDKQAELGKTQLKQAEADIDDVYDYVKSEFMIMRDKHDEENIRTVGSIPASIMGEVTARIYACTILAMGAEYSVKSSGHNTESSETPRSRL